MMNELTNEEQAVIELRHIQLELQGGRTQHFRSFVDQYYCYKNGHVRPKSKRANWEDIVWTGIVSVEAIKLRKKSRKEGLTDQAIRKMVVKEHVVPLKVITKLLLDLVQKEDYLQPDDSTKKDTIQLAKIAKVLDKHTIFGTITKEGENAKLNEAKLNSAMPDGFGKSGDPLFKDPLARYKHINMKFEDRRKKSLQDA